MFADSVFLYCDRLDIRPQDSRELFQRHHILQSVSRLIEQGGTDEIRHILPVDNGIIVSVVRLITDENGGRIPFICRYGHPPHRCIQAVCGQIVPALQFSHCRKLLHRSCQ